MNISLRLIIITYDLPVQSMRNYAEFNDANIISSIIAPIFCLGSMVLIKRFEQGKPLNYVGPVFVVLFALFIMISGMRSTFFAMHNPRNTLVMYLAGLVITGVFFTFEYFETAILTLVTAICFSLLIPYYQAEYSEIFLNNLASLILLTIFFCISRFAFSNRADNFLKLEAIKEKNLEIETASKLKNEILGIVAHDLRNPLTAIRTLAGMMEEDPTINADNQENVQMIKMSCDKATSIINDLIETAHNDKENVFDIEEVELNQYLLKIVDEWAKDKTGHTNILYYGTSQPIFTHINMEKMQRVMDNLISNAIKFSGDSDHIEIRLRDADGQIFIDVKDFGMGIPEKLLPYIFDRFSRASRRGIRGEESVGLGLSIVKQIVEKHGGSITVISTEKQGTTFTIHMTPVRHNNTEKQR
ncbi:sensor histidine kinase KdpD [Mucilaginibacter sp. UR6-11]|uniref:sensor histidine kinase n=1 Tax=Mucilaginibacter sp. UR6-11 TaxID=1435644 RepID=UPI001E5FDBC6|nr:HAMP domain-containing sensor histidine kinase [Mucilaginibacter sp. UR6-11]MCC8425579.1 HAMP domain-containing histidine kinase [Mucilaginibacter sp. UR6-11]